MRDHFDPALDMDTGPLVFAPQHSIRPAAPQTQQELRVEYVHATQQPTHFVVNRSPSPGMSSSSLTGASASSFADIMPSPRSSTSPTTIPTRDDGLPFANVHTSTHSFGVKRQLSEMDECRNSRSPLDCQSLQSSLKRVKLACSPGELRLQRDLKMLPPHEWQQVSPQCHPERASSPSHTTWVHVATGTRLTLVDSLRLCLFMPKTLDNKHYHHPHYEWRMMIQIPRMFPHRPPVLSRLEGNLSVQQVIIHEAPPVAAAGQPSSSEQEDCGYGENHSIMGSVPMTATATTPSNREPLYDALASTIVWNKWSVVSNLSDLLDFLLDLATSLDSNSENASASALSRPAGFQSSSSRLVSSDEGAWQTHSLSSSSSWTGSQHDSARELHFLMEEHKLDDPTSATATITMSTASGDNTTAVVTKNDKSVGSLSFLPPNRFDVGYQKYSNGKSVGFEAAAAATTSTPSELEKIHDDAAMDMNE